MVVAKIELCNVAMQVLLSAVLIDALHASLEDTVVALKGVRVGIAPDVLARAMRDELMAGEDVSDLRVLTGLIRHDGGLFGDVRADDRHEMGGRRTIDVKGPDHTAALDKGHDGPLVTVAPAFHSAFLRTDKGLVDLDDLAFTAHRGQVARAQRLADAMRQEPRAFVRDAERPMNLVGAATLLGGAQKIDRLEHLVQRDLGALEDGPDLDCELLAAIGALAEAEPALAEIVVLPANGAAVGAHRTLRPQQPFEFIEGSGFIVKVGGGQGGHGLGSDVQTLP